ncbi:hypothetical protein M405DRAFT_794832 [Rhizopogon salebrosus TDB-379]|nr:hypothetical protein M405DRAFT_794832 [Rhizopogon salebrosus TDB-379]
MEPTIYIETSFILPKSLAVASAALIIYDHIITFDQEVVLFWSGAWDASRILYLGIRYLGLIQAFISTNLYLGVSEFTPTVVKALLAVNVVLITAGAALCQAVITLRVWYLFPRNKLIRRFAASLYIVCTYSTWVLTGILFKRLFQEMQHPNLVKNPSIFAVLFVPGFVIHTVLFALKIYRYMTSDRFQRRSSLLAGFLKEGLAMYACATGSILYTIITLTLSNPSQLDIYFTGLEGGFVVGATIVSVCHALLSIRSLSATLHIDPAWLLSHAELSRVHWTKGDSEGEIFVELQGSNNTALPMVNIPRAETPSVIQSSDPGVLIKSY